MKIKDTLNMPNTDFNMKANLGVNEPIWQQEWYEQDIYKKVLEKNKNKKEFYLHDGPPYANGNLHPGHMLNKVLKDIIIRSKNMNGYYAPIIFGWDTHGLPIENAMLKQLKKNFDEFDDVILRKNCEKYALEQVNIQKEQFFNIGLLSNKNKDYLTLYKDYEKGQINIFKSMVEKNIIYKGLKPVYWSWSSQSALAEAEVEYIEKKSPAIYVPFLINHPDFQNVEIVIWTTTPWTLPANMGVSVGSDFIYQIINVNNRKLLIAKDLVETFLNDIEVTEYSVEKEIKGSELENISVINPINEKEFIIMLGDHVTIDSGTGCVHTAPGHGEDDFIVGKKYNLDIFSIVDEKGYLNENAGNYQGIFYEDANKEITQFLEKNNKLLKLSFIKHSYPHDWRTKKPIIFRATPQWFANLEPIKSDLLSAIDNVHFVNEWGKVRLKNMIEKRNEWCISRQRKWGVPIPIFYTEKKEPIMDLELINHVANLFEQFGSDVWFEKEVKDLLPKDYKHPDSPNNIFYKETDIMDVWFDSGSSHLSVLEKEYGIKQADLYLEGSDQYRGWFNSSLITSVASKGMAPYKALLSHGFVVDGKGNKMSKSLGNTIDPQKIIKKRGADILRLWVANTDYQSDISLSEDILDQISEMYRKFRNTLRFMLGNVSDFSKEEIVEFEKLEDVDKFMLMKLEKINQNVKEYYEKYEFKKIVDEINNYIINELSSFYLDFIKDIVYINKKYDFRRKQIQTVLYIHLDYILKLMAPILPHTTYEAYNVFKNENIMLTDFNQEMIEIDENLCKKFEEFLKIRDVINKEIENKRAEKIIGKSFNAKISFNPKNEYKDLIESINDLDVLCIVSKFEISEQNDGEDTIYGNIKVEKYDEIECQRCRKFFKEEEILNYQIEDEKVSCCHKCYEIIKEFDENN